MQVTDMLRREIAPTGVLRAALNHGNRVLVSRGEDGQAYGITVDLARSLAERLSLPLEFVHMERAVDVSSSAGEHVYDICFLAVDPARAETLHFTHPYVQIEGAYLLGADCPVADAHPLVSDGHPVATVKGSAYTLDLSRKAGAEHLVLYDTIDLALAALDAGDVVALAGIRNVMEAEAAKRSGARVADPSFMAIRQAMGLPRGRDAAADYLDAFVADMARSGQVADILTRHGVPASCAVIPD